MAICQLRIFVGTVTEERMKWRRDLLSAFTKRQRWTPEIQRYRHIPERLWSLHLAREIMMLSALDSDTSDIVLMGNGGR